MALRTIASPILMIGDTAADRPAAPPADGIFVDKQLGTVQVFSGAWAGANPTFSSAATLTALKAIVATSRYDGLIVKVQADQSLWYFHSTSALTGDNLFVATPDAGSGRWLRLPGALDLSLPIAFGTADAAILATVPTGALVQLYNLFWEVTADWTGGSSSAIGVSSSNGAGMTTKGDLLGGTGGDVAATLVASTGIVPGTTGAKMDADTEVHAAILLAGNTIRFDRITSAFTAGTGNVRVLGQLLRNAGA